MISLGKKWRYGMDFKDKIRTIPDFPIPGVQYRDITSLLEDPQVFNSVCTDMCFHAHKFNTDVIIGIESRGFIFGTPVAHKLSVPFIPARKPGKLPNKTVSRSFDLEYGSTSLEIQKNTDISADSKIIIIDDLIATGGTALACADLLHENWYIPKEQIVILSVIDLPDLKGSAIIREQGYNVHTLIEFEGG
jgi:adenine phosphoribosyltransferase